MSSSNLQNERASSYLSGGSMAYVDSLYEDYLADPILFLLIGEQYLMLCLRLMVQKRNSLIRDIRDYFLQNADKKAIQVVQSADSQQYQVAHLINAYRSLGHHAAKLIPWK